jgi:hypothetical protein
LPAQIPASTLKRKRLTLRSVHEAHEPIVLTRDLHLLRPVRLLLLGLDRIVRVGLVDEMGLLMSGLEQVDVLLLGVENVSQSTELGPGCG